MASDTDDALTIRTGDWSYDPVYESFNIILGYDSEEGVWPWYVITSNGDTDAYVHDWFERPGRLRGGTSCG